MVSAPGTASFAMIAAEFRTPFKGRNSMFEDELIQPPSRDSRRILKSEIIPRYLSHNFPLHLRLGFYRLAREQNTSLIAMWNCLCSRLRPFGKVLKSDFPALQHFLFHDAPIDLQLSLDRTILLPLAVLTI
jgi:hypothetical protein